MVEPDFGLNNFNEPKMFNESETKINNILALLFMRPGAYPSLPNLGINIGKYLYMFFDEINCEKIKSDIASQCIEFLDYIEDGTLDVMKTVYQGRPLLLITLPVKIEEKVTGMVLGLTTSLGGSIVYNFAYDNSII